MIQGAIHDCPQQCKTKDLQHIAGGAKHVTEFGDDMLVDECLHHTSAFLQYISNRTTGAQHSCYLHIDEWLLYILVLVQGMASMQLPAALDVDVFLDATTILLCKGCRVLAKTVDTTLGWIIGSFPEGRHLQ